MLLVAVRAAVILAAALLAVRLLARTSAATRRSVLVAAFAVVLVMPIASALLPALHLRGADAVVENVALAATAPPDAIVENIVAAQTRPDVPIAPSIAPASAPSSLPISPFVLLWLLGVTAVLARFAVGLLRAHRLVRRSRFVETLEHAEVRTSDAIDTPAVTGLLRAVVLLPREADSWTPERRRLVLAHELAHVASRDCLANAMAQLVVALHWFNPLAWVALRRLRIVRELAADDRVLAGDAVPSSYAEHLLALATARAVPAGALAMAEPSQISVRIRALLGPRPRALGRARFALVGAGLGVALLVACATPEREVAPAPTAEASSATPAAAANPAQQIIEEEIDRLTADWGPCAAIILVLDPHTGHVVAAAHRGGTEATAEQAARRPFVPGSTVKPLVIAAAIDDGVITSTDRFDTSPQPFTSELPPIIDQTPHPTLDVGGILAVSSNVGLAKIYDKLGPTKQAAWMKRFHFASAPATLPAGVAGAAYAIGAKLPSNPLEVTAAFAALANNGVYHAPSFTPTPSPPEQLVRSETAMTVLALLEGVTGDGGTGKNARVAGIRVAGKTGTVHLGPDNAKGERDDDYYASFVGTAPLEKPRYVVFVGVETPRKGGTGGTAAAPTFSRVMTRLLAR